jgi:hypothetical protein
MCPSALLRSLFFILIIFLNEINVVAPLVRHVLPFFVVPVACHVCSVDVIVLTSLRNTVNAKTRIAVAQKAQHFA